MIGSFLLNCSGASPDILEKCPRHETTIHAGIGGVILGTAALALLSGGYALYTIFKNPWVAGAFGLAWALIIFNLDRYIISTVKKTGSFWSEINSCLPRLLLAVLIGFTISEPLKLELFRSEIQEELADKLGARKKEVGAGFDRQSTLLDDSRKTNDRDRARKRDAANQLCRDRQATITTAIARMETENADRDRIKQERYDHYLGECSGKAGTGIRGEGPECRRTRKAYETALEEWRETVAANNPKISALRKNLVGLDILRQTELEKIDREWELRHRRIGEKEQAIAQKKNETMEGLEKVFSDGFLSRYTALNDLVKPASGTPGHELLWSPCFSSLWRLRRSYPR